jgi:hypothetical protein
MPLERKSPMKRTGFARKPGSPFSSFANAKTAMKRTEMKKRAKRKPTVAEGSKYIDACRGEECYLRVPGVCCSLGWAHESVVDCHSNQSKHGKGAGLKAKHEFTVPGCAPCHFWLDRGPAPWEAKVLTFDTALEMWVPIRERKMGLPEVECSFG